jgi:hypothetical protein
MKPINFTVLKFIHFVLILVMNSSCLFEKPSESKLGNSLGKKSFETQLDENTEDEVEEEEEVDETLYTDSLTSLIPQSGSTTVNTNLTLLGKGFKADLMQVFIGAIQCSDVEVVNAAQLTCTIAPQAAGTYDVTIKKNGVTLNTIENAFIYISDFGAPFAVNSIFPQTGSTAGGTTITVNGSDFDGTVIFQVDGVNCQTTTIINSTTGTCVTPASTLGYKDFIAKKGAQTDSIDNAFRYTGAPILTSISPTSVTSTISQTLTLNGENFVAGATVNIVTNAGTYTCNSVSVAVDSESLTCSTPALSAAVAASISGDATITIINPDAQNASLISELELVKPPTYTSVGFTGGVTAAPVDGVFSNNGTPITMAINGSNFKAGVTVKLGGLSASNCTRFSDSQINCTSLPDQGSDLTGSYVLLIQNTDNQSISTTLTLAGRPDVSTISPTVASPSGGTTVSLSGDNTASGFAEPAAVVRFRNQSNTLDLGACTVTSSATPVQCTSPNIGSAQNISIRFTNSYGYTKDFVNVFTLANPAEMITTWPTSVGNGDGTSAVGKMALGSNFTIVLRAHNTSSSVPITSMSLDTSALTGTNFTLDNINTTCGTTLGTLSSCDYYFTYDAQNMEVIKQTSPIIINFSNGQTMTTKTFTFGNVWTVPIRIHKDELDFGTIPYGQGVGGAWSRYSHVVEITNPSSASVTINPVTTVISGSGFEFSGGSFPGTHPSTRFQSGACAANGVMPANSKCFLSIDFKPNSANTFNETLTITYNDTQTKTVDLTGVSSEAVRACNTTASNANFGGGDGLSAATAWRLCSKQHWMDMASWTNSTPATYANKFYIQVGDLDINDENFSPVNIQNGTFNGGGFRLNNITLTRVSTNYTAPFYTQGNFYSVQMVDVTISATGTSTYVGGVVSYGGNFYDSYVTGSITSYYMVGGFQGTTFANTLDNLYSNVALTTTHQMVGGIVGFMTTGNASLTNVQSFGSISTTQAYGGGIVGYDNSTGNHIVEDAYSSSTIYCGGGYCGGIFGGIAHSSGSTVLIKNTIFNGTLTSTQCVGGILGYADTTGNVTVSQSGVYGTVNSSSNYAGGVVGLIYDGSYIKESFFAGTFNPSGNYWGGITGYTGYIQNSIMVGTITASLTTGGGFSTYAPTIQNSYLASIPTKVSIKYITSAWYNALNAGSQNSATHSAFYILTGTGNGQTGTNIIYRDEAQMATSLPGLTDNATLWKYAPSGYPYPLLNWMPDDFMP